MPRVLLFGTGAIGGFYAYVLCKAPDVELTVVCRSNFDAVRENGLIVDSESIGKGTARPHAVVRSCEEAQGPFDFVVVAAKALPGTAKLIKSTVGSPATIVLLQNGILIEEEYSVLYPDTPIVSACVYAPTTQPEPGKFYHVTRDQLLTGAWPKDHEPGRERAQQFAQFIKAGGATASFVDNVQVNRWQKVVGNAYINPLCALTRCPDAFLYDSGRDVAPGMLTSEQLCRDVMHEMGLIASSEGYNGEEAVQHADDNILKLSLTRTFDTAISPSMLQDVRRGSRLEVEAILGNAVRKAHEKQISVPKLDMIYVLTKGLDRAMQEHL